MWAILSNCTNSTTLYIAVLQVSGAILKFGCYATADKKYGIELQSVKRSCVTTSTLCSLCMRLDLSLFSEYPSSVVNVDNKQSFDFGDTDLNSRRPPLFTMVAAHTNGIICPTPLAWTKSGTYIAVPFGRLLQIYDLTTSPPMRLATADPHGSTITAVLGLPKMQFASASHDSTIKIWDALDGQCFQTIDVSSPIFGMCKVPNAILCINKSRLVRVEINPPNKMTTIIDGCKFHETSRISSAEDGSIVALINGKSLFVLSLSNSFENGTGTTAKGRKSKNSVSRPYLEVQFDSVLHAVAVSVSGNQLAVSGEKGLIYYIANPKQLVSNLDRTQKVKFIDIHPAHFHWHSSPVQTLQFAHGDTNLLSAGQEGVLVNWTLTAVNFGVRNFLPRVGAPILAVSVSPDETQYALSLCDNSVSIILQSTRDIHSVIRSIACRIVKDSSTGRTKTAAHDRMSVCDSPNPGCIILANENTRIQEFNAVQGEHVCNINVVPMNETFKQVDDGLSPITASHVSNVAMHPKGMFMATVDVTQRNADIDKQLQKRKDKVVSLRIWQRRAESSWDLCAVVVNPHGESESIVSLIFHPTLNVLLTLGTDHKFKFWRATTVQDKDEMQISGSWRCELSKTYRNKLCRCASFSSDGSILAVGCDNLVSIWTFRDLLQGGEEGSTADLVGFQSDCSIELEYLDVLMQPPMDDVIHSLGFVMNNIPLFIAATANGVYVWDALTLDIVWSIAVLTDAKTLCVDPDSGRFAIAVKVPSITSPISNHENRIEAEEEQVRTPGKQIESVTAAEGLDVMDIDVATASHSTPKRNAQKKPGKAQHDEQKRSASNRRGANTNHAAVIFDGSSPTPIHIHQLTREVGVSSLSFMETAGAMKGNNIVKSAGNATNHGNRSLLCIDSSLEVSMIRAEDGQDVEVSLTSDEPLNAGVLDEHGGNALNKLDSLFGAGWHDEAIATRLEAADIATSIDPEHEHKPKNALLEQAFEDYLAGPVHVQAPVSVQSLEFTKALLSIPSETSSLGKSRGAHDKGGKDVNGKDGTDEMDIAVQEGEEEVWMADGEMDLKTMREFCMKLASEISQTSSQREKQQEKEKDVSVEKDKKDRKNKSNQSIEEKDISDGDTMKFVSNESPENQKMFHEGDKQHDASDEVTTKKKHSADEENDKRHSPKSDKVKRSKSRTPTKNRLAGVHEKTGSTPTGRVNSNSKIKAEKKSKSRTPVKDGPSAGEKGQRTEREERKKKSATEGNNEESSKQQRIANSPVRTTPGKTARRSSKSPKRKRRQSREGGGGASAQHPR